MGRAPEGQNSDNLSEEEIEAFARVYGEFERRRVYIGLKESQLAKAKYGAYRRKGKQLEPWKLKRFNNDREHYRLSLYGDGTFGLPYLDAFAELWLEELKHIGLRGAHTTSGVPLKGPLDSREIPSGKQTSNNAYPVQLDKSKQTLWVKLDGPRSERGYKSITVSDEPLLTDNAILAALTVLEGRPIDVESLSKTLRKLDTPIEGTFLEFWHQAVNELSSPDTETSVTQIGQAEDILKGLQHWQPLDYVLTLLRYYRPGFDNLECEEQIALVERTCTHINEFLEALHKLLAFIEYGTPGRRLTPATKTATRDVRAAVLRDIDGLTYREIGRELDLPLPKDFNDKGDHPAVRMMVERGRNILKRALGEDGWQRQSVAMKAEAERWRSLNAREQEAEEMAEALGSSAEEAYQKLGSEFDWLIEKFEEALDASRQGGQPIYEEFDRIVRDVGEPEND